MQALEDELKLFIIETLNLEDISANEIDSHEPLFVDGLGLDSIDALELGVAIQRKYGVRIDAGDENVRQHFASVHNLARFIETAREGQ